ncbi:MAG: UbiA family prenyltransferase [Desulfobacterales bacterium]
MEQISSAAPGSFIPIIARLKFFLALSRTPHGLLDMATPCFAALLCLGGFPSAFVVLVGLITTFAGYTAVYALNDLVDYQIDREKMEKGRYCNPDDYLDALMIRHPIAQGCLSFHQGLVWACGWSGVAIVGAYLLNPVCVLIFLAGCFLEAIYCIMWRLSPARAIVSGVVKTAGPVAGIFAVDPNPSPVFVMVLFLSLFFWEIGGQNIPADWTDLDSDRRLKAQTIPVKFGPAKASEFLLLCLMFALLLMFISFQLSEFGAAIFAGLLSLVWGIYLLLIPALRLYQTNSRTDAMALFNKSSYYPVALLSTALIHIVFF